MCVKRVREQRHFGYFGLAIRETTRFDDVNDGVVRGEQATLHLTRRRERRDDCGTSPEIRLKMRGNVQVTNSPNPRLQSHCNLQWTVRKHIGISNLWLPNCFICSNKNRHVSMSDVDKILLFMRSRLRLTRVSR